MSKGAQQGDLVVAANAVLLNLFEVSAYMIDGFAYASEALVGQAIGARDPARYGQAIRLTTLWALCFGALSSLAIWIFGPQLVGLMTVNPEVIAMAMVFLPWAAVTPLLGTICFQFDGIFTGRHGDARDAQHDDLVSRHLSCELLCAGTALWQSRPVGGAQHFFHRAWA